MKKYINKNNLVYLGIFLLCLIVSFSVEEYIFISESILNDSINLLINEHFDVAYLFSGDVFSSSLIANLIISLLSFSSKFYALLKVFNILIGLCFIGIVLYQLRGNYLKDSNKSSSFAITLILSALILLISPYSFISYKISMLSFVFFIYFWEKANIENKIKYYIICGVISLLSFSFILYLAFVIFTIVKYLTNNKDNLKIKILFISIVSGSFVVLCGIFFQLFKHFDIKAVSDIISDQSVLNLIFILGNSIIPNLNSNSNFYISLLVAFVGIFYYILVIFTFKNNKSKLALSLVTLSIIIFVILVFDLDITYSFNYLFFYNILYLFPELIAYINEVGKKYIPILLSIAIIIFGVGLVENNNYDIDREDYLISAYYDSEYIVNVFEVSDIFGCDKSVFSNSLKKLSLMNKLDKYKLMVDESIVSIDKLIPVYGNISYEVEGEYWRFEKNAAFLTYCKEDYLYLNLYLPQNNLNNEFVIYVNDEEIYRDVAVGTSNNILINISKYKGEQVYFKINFEKINYENNFDELCFEMSSYKYLDTSVSTDESLVDLSTIRKIYGFGQNEDGSSWLSKKNLFELHVTSNKVLIGLFFTEYGTPNKLSVKINDEVVHELAVEFVGNQYIALTLDVQNYIGQNVIVEFSFDKDFYPPNYGVQDYRELSAMIVSLSQHN